MPLFCHCLAEFCFWSQRSLRRLATLGEAGYSRQVEAEVTEGQPQAEAEVPSQVKLGILLCRMV